LAGSMERPMAGQWVAAKDCLKADPKGGALVDPTECESVEWTAAGMASAMAELSAVWKAGPRAELVAVPTAARSASGKAGSTAANSAAWTVARLAS
jgi:hypothetical protein